MLHASHVPNVWCRWANSMYVLSEVKNPVGTIKIAGPLGLATCGVLYILANVAYFAAATVIQGRRGRSRSGGRLQRFSWLARPFNWWCRSCGRLEVRAIHRLSRTGYIVLSASASSLPRLFIGLSGGLQRLNLGAIRLNRTTSHYKTEPTWLYIAVSLGRLSEEIISHRDQSSSTCTDTCTWETCHCVYLYVFYV